MSHDSLESYYRMNMKLATDFHLDIMSVETMMPFEREVYIALIIEDLEKKKSDAFT